MQINSKIYVAGHTGLVGSSLMRKLKSKGYTNILTRTIEKLDLTKQKDVYDFFKKEKPEYVILSAAKVGGIHANNTFPADFININLAIQQNILNASYENNVKRLLFLGSGCIYPSHCKQPIKEEYLLTGPLEPTNRPYAIAKIAGIEQCWAYNRQYKTKFLSLMPSNLYGPKDNYNLQNSHVLPALIRKTHEAKINKKKQIIIWGTGLPKREFLYVDDLADSILFLINLPKEKYNNLINKYETPPIINIGYGKDITIFELAELITKIIGFQGKIICDTKKPDGTPVKLLDINKITKLGWEAKTTLKDGIEKTYRAYLDEINNR